MLNMCKMFTLWKKGYLIGIFKEDWLSNKPFQDLGNESNLDPSPYCAGKKRHSWPCPIFPGFIACWLCVKYLLSENGEIIGIYKVEWLSNKPIQDLGTRSNLNPGMYWIRKKRHIWPCPIFPCFIACRICVKCILSEKREIIGIFKVEWLSNKSIQDLETRSILNPGMYWMRKKRHTRPCPIFPGFIACWLRVKYLLSEVGK